MRKRILILKAGLNHQVCWVLSSWHILVYFFTCQKRKPWKTSTNLNFLWSEPLTYLTLSRKLYTASFMTFNPFCILRFRRKCTFSPYILIFFHFGPYIFILQLLVPKPINAWHLSPYCHPTNRKYWCGWWHSKIIIKKNLFWH